MAGQINLYNARYLKRRELLTLANVFIAAGLIVVALAGASALAWRTGAARQAEAAVAEATLQQLREQLEVEARAAGNRRPSPQLAAEVARFEALLQRRERILKLLDSGAVGNTSGFSEFLRGLARQAPEGLWLTGFSIAAGGADMEIRGRMLDGAALPEFIRRLGTEKAFQGRSFAALTVTRPDMPQAVPAAAAGGALPAPAAAPRHVDFILTPRLEQSPGASR